MERSVYSHLGSDSGKVVVRPGKGLDNGVFRLEGGNLMIATVDPVSVIPAFGMKLSAWLSVHLIASDYTTSGLDPEYAVFSYNFPPRMGEAERGVFVSALGDACRELKVTIVAGHTGSYPGGGFTVIGAGTMMGEAGEGGYITPAMAEVGDSVVMTKQAAIEAAGSLATSFPLFTEKEGGAVGKAEGRKLLAACTTVQDARSARKIGVGPGAVTSMHDATEGGVLGGLDEMASASGKSFLVDPSLVRVSDEVRRVCAAFGLNPLETMGEGALLITCARGRVDELVRTLRRDGIRSTVIGEVEEGRGLSLRRRDGSTRLYAHRGDGYWRAYDRATRLGLK